MTKQNLPDQNENKRARSKLERTESAMSEFNSSAASLRTEADRARGVLGIGRRILVPPDEIHVIVGDGRHTWLLSSARKVFGQTADRPSRYWLNKLTQVIKLKTISFTVPIRGHNDEGVEALDNSKVSFRLWAHAVAKLNPDKAEIAAQRVGLDTTGLINTIMEVGKAELIAAGATMELKGIIAERQKLAEIAFPKVNQILSELGYDLALLTITKLDGIAYDKLVEQAESRVSKETSIATNLEQVAELKDDQSRERTEAEIRANTEKKLAFERLEAKREVETTTLNQEEALAIRSHEVNILQIEREKTAAESSHERDLTKVELNKKLGEGQAEKDARIAKITAERAAELRAIQQKRNAEIKLAESDAEAQRLALVQIREIERQAERTQAEAKRLSEEELAAAERAKDVALTEASQVGESLKVEAEAEARALQTKVDAETKAELMKAEAEATASEKRAQAAKIRADATRAETAAPGLAEAEVEAARVEVAEKQVIVSRADGLAQAEVAQAQAEAEAERLRRMKEVEINAQKQLVALYDKAPVLVELEKIRMEHAHQEKITTLQMDAYLKAFESIAPGVRVNIFGSGDKASRVFNDMMSLSHGVGALGEEIPLIGRFLENESAESATPIWGKLRQFLPYVQEILSDMNPRVFSSLKIADLVERLEPVIAGREDLAAALGNIRDDASFRMVGDLPVKPLLGWLGMNMDDKEEGDNDDIVAGSIGEDEREDEALSVEA
ncbi:MAG: hypothetical protein HN390_07600 [Anaerolineae bacterium]|nr:hypothetical protein [Anaerolineae bacterium]MBT7191648.1 hypothetical protein [Anaerolineae bacterium]